MGQLLRRVESRAACGEWSSYSGEWRVGQLLRQMEIGVAAQEGGERRVRQQLRRVESGVAVQASGE